MKVEPRPWAVVLAAGCGNRLSSLTRTAGDGTSIPKQFCSLAGSATLLEDALARARRLTSAARIVAVVAREHECWWQSQLTTLPAENVIVQPQNRGTGIGILLTALHVYRRAPDSTIVFLPSDHFILDEAAITRCLQRGVNYLASDVNSLLLLGITPDEIDPDLGYIVPGAETGAGIFGVTRFVEKPDLVATQALLATGSVWNSFIFAVRARTLLDLFARRAPGALHAMRHAFHRDEGSDTGGQTLMEVYRALDDLDFSRDVLQGNETALRVLSAPRCGWTDLGTPSRVGRCVERLGARPLPRRARAADADAPFMDLASAYSRLNLAS